MSNEKYLKPVKTKEEAQAKGRIGGIKSGIAKRKKKLMTDIYLEFLAKKFKIEVNGKYKSMTGHQIIEMVIGKVMSRGDSSSVSLMKEIREATEGTKLHVDFNDNIDDMREALIDELKKANGHDKKPVVKKS